MAFDPASGNLWLEENGEDSFSELHRIEPGQNGGWVQITGPVSRIAEYRAIETGKGPDACHDPDPPDPNNPPVFFGFEQGRFDPTRIAATPEEALSKLVMLPETPRHWGRRISSPMRSRLRNRRLMVREFMGYYG
jgi:aldose sugar dehydrogenase